LQTAAPLGVRRPHGPQSRSYPHNRGAPELPVGRTHKLQRLAPGRRWRLRPAFSTPCFALASAPPHNKIIIVLCGDVAWRKGKIRGMEMAKVRSTRRCETWYGPKPRWLRCKHHK